MHCGLTFNNSSNCRKHERAYCPQRHAAAMGRSATERGDKDAPRESRSSSGNSSTGASSKSTADPATTSTATSTPGKKNSCKEAEGEGNRRQAVRQPNSDSSCGGGRGSEEGSEPVESNGESSENDS